MAPALSLHSKRLGSIASIWRSVCRCRSISSSADPYIVEWSETPYLELVLGLQPEGKFGGVGSMLAAVRGENRCNSGYYGRLLRMRIENAPCTSAREWILDGKNHLRDVGHFWIPMLADLMGGDYHQCSLEVFTWLTNNPIVLQAGSKQDLEKLYSMMISYAAVIGRLRLARIWFDDLSLQKGIRHSRLTCNALLMAYAKKGDAQTALSILEQMKAFRRGCLPDALTYYILIAMFVKLNDSPGLTSLLRESAAAGVRPDTMTFNTLLCGYSKMARKEDFDKTLRELEEQESCHKRAGGTYNAMLVGYSRLDCLDKLQGNLAEMQARAIPVASMAVAEEIAKAYCRNGWIQGLDKVIRAVEEAPGISPTSAFQIFVAQAYESSGKNLSRKVEAVGAM